MEELKSLFGDGSLSYEQFEQKLSEAGDTIKLANLKSGNYVDKAKYDKVESGINEWKIKFNALEEKTKDYDSLLSERDTLKADYTALQSKQAEAEKMSEIGSANVNPRFAKFVYAEVTSQMKDGDDFKTSLGEYLKENKEFLNTSKGTYVNLESGTTPPKTKNETMNDLIRRK